MPTLGIRRERNFGLDVARCAAILLVLVDHFGIYVFRPAQPYQRLFFPLGFLGVELFFVLSGFLIGQILFEMIVRAGRVTPRLVVDFWVRRWLRTLPNYFLFLGLHALSPQAQLSVAYLFFCQNLTSPMRGSFPISWSLAVEEWFYLLLPLLALPASRLTRRPIASILLAAALLFFVSAAARMLLGPGRMWENGVRTVVMLRLDSLMFGVVLAAFRLFRPPWFGALGKSWLAALNAVSLLALYAVTASQFDSQDFRATRANLLLFFWADVAFALAVAWLWHWQPRAFPFRKPVELTSLWAYSLYLCHAPVMRALLKTPLRPTGQDDPLRIPKVLLIAMASFVVAACVYRFFEKPIMDLRRRLPSIAGDRRSHTNA